MKKMIRFSSLLLILSLSVFAQDQATTKDMLCKKWTLIGMEEFGQPYDLRPEQVNDYLNFLGDMTYVGIMSGKAVQGKWSESKGTVNVAANSEKSEFKTNWIRVEKLNADTLSLKYQSPDLIKTVLFYKPAN